MQTSRAFTAFYRKQKFGENGKNVRFSLSGSHIRKYAHTCVHANKLDNGATLYIHVKMIHF